LPFAVRGPRGFELTIRKEAGVSILWIIVIVIVVLALLGFFSRGRF
jgi:hypothetical protein